MLRSSLLAALALLAAGCGTRPPTPDAVVTGVALSREGKDKLASRKWLLDTYAECLDAARGARRYAKSISGSGAGREEARGARRR